MDDILTDTSARAAARTWLDHFGAALTSGETARIAALFAAECHWRDLLAFTWDLHTTSGAEAVATRMLPALAGMKPHGLALAADRTLPRRVERAGTEAVEAIFRFETAVGPCNGVVRLVSEAGENARLDADDRAGRDPRS